MPSSHGQLHSVDLFVVGAYFAIMLWIGVYFYNLMRGMRDYFSGGQQIPWWLSGVSHYMSTFSAFAFVVNSALVYQYGLVGIAVFWAQIPGTLLCALVFSKRWRRARIDSPVEYLEARYGVGMRQLVAWHGIPVKIIDDALKLVAIAAFISFSVGLSVEQGMFAAGLIILAYTFMGGLWAVAVTDFVQFVVMTAAVVVLFVLSLVKAGGIGNVVGNAPEGFLRLTSPEYGWFYLAAMVFLYALSMSSVHWQLIQRFCCVPDEREARKMGLLVAGLQLVTPAIMFLPALAAHQFLREPVEPRQIYPVLCTHLLPPGLMGLMIAAMLAATMSMLSGDYNVCASVLTNDVYRRLVRPCASERELVLVGRVATLLVGLLALALAWVMVGLGGDKLFRTMVTLFSIATAPVAVPMILGLLSKRMTSAGALAGFLAGLAAALALFAALPEQVEWFGVRTKTENIILFAGAFTSAATMTGVSRLVPRGVQEAQRVAPFLRRLSTPVGSLDEDHSAVSAGSAAVSPFRVVGLCIISIAGVMLIAAPFVRERLALALDLAIGVVLLAFGGAMTWRAGSGVRPNRGVTAA